MPELVLTSAEIAAITGRRTLRQQVNALVRMGVPVRVRPRAPMQNAVVRANLRHSLPHPLPPSLPHQDRCVSRCGQNNSTSITSPFDGADPIVIVTCAVDVADTRHAVVPLR